MNTITDDVRARFEALGGLLVMADTGVTSVGAIRRARAAHAKFTQEKP